MMCIISKERIAFCPQEEGTRGVVFAASPITLQSRCKRVPNEPIPAYGHSWPSPPECSFKIGHRQSEKKRWNSDRSAMCNATRGIEAARGVIRHWGVSDSSDGARPLWRSHSAQTEIFFADAYSTPANDRNTTTPARWGQINIKQIGGRYIKYVTHCYTARMQTPVNPQLRCRWQSWACRRLAWEYLESLQSNLGKTTSSLGMLLMLLEIIATTYGSTIFKTDVFSLYSSYLSIYIAPHLHRICLDWLQAVLEINSRCGWKWQSSELRDTLRACKGASLVKYLEPVIEHYWRLHFKAMIDWTWRL